MSNCSDHRSSTLRAHGAHQVRALRFNRIAPQLDLLKIDAGASVRGSDMKKAMLHVLSVVQGSGALSLRHSGACRGNTLPTCKTVLEVFDGQNLVAYRLTVQPSVKTLHDAL
jgi:hypothetical protein